MNDLGFLESVCGLGYVKGSINFLIVRLLPEGINIVENEPKFEKTFGFEVNLAVFKFSWSKTEK